MKNKFWLFIILLMVGTACAQKQDIPSMSVDDLAAKMKTDSSLIILDVRTPQELVGPLGHIEGVVNIPVQVLSNRIDELDKYKDNNIAVICRSGNRSTIGTKILLENGFKATNVIGGMKAYRQKIKE